MFLTQYKIITLSLLLIFLANFISSNNLMEQDKTGIKLAIKQDLILNFKNKFLPEIINKLSNYTLPDQNFQYDILIGKINILLQNTIINLNTTNITDENLIFSFKTPNKIFLELKNITGTISLDNTISLLPIIEISHLKANLLYFDLKLELNLTQVESKKNKGQMLPSLALTTNDLVFDFEFDISGNILADLINEKFIKSILTGLVKTGISSIFSDTIKQTINSYIDNAVSSLPLYFLINDQGLAFNYEILNSPKISSEFVILNSKGTVVNTQINKTLNPPFELPANVPDFEADAKNAEILISDFSINSALYTLFLSKVMNINVTTDNLPGNLPLKLNTTTLDIFFNGLSNQYGLDKKIDMDCSALEAPMVNLVKESINFLLKFECTLNVLKDENITEQALRFNSSMIADLGFNLGEKGHVVAMINKLNLANTTIIESNVSEIYIQNVENLINFGSNIISPYLNRNILNNFTIPLDFFSGVDLSDSAVRIKDNYIDVDVNPIVSSSLIKNRLDKFLN